MDERAVDAAPEPGADRSQRGGAAGYRLGIDVGTTCVAAAVRRGDGATGAEVVPLGTSGPTVPAALHLARDGSVTVGDGALRLAGIDPGRVVRAVARRVGDQAPVIVGGEPWSAEDLLACLVRWVVDRVAEREGAAATRIALAHPAPWPAHTLERLATALAGQGVRVTFVAEPVAAVRAVRAGSASDDPVAVYDLGGGRFDAAVVRRGDPARPGPGFGLLGRPEGLTDVGGLDVDELVWRHVRAGLPEGVVPDARVRRACLRAKEALSTKAEVVVKVKQGELRGEVSLDRAEFERLITPHVDRTVAALRRTVASAGLGPDELAAVLLVGGSSRIPLVARAVSVQLGRPVTVPDDPELLVARGAALALPAAADEQAAGLVSTASGYLAVPTPALAADPASTPATGPDEGDPGRSEPADEEQAAPRRAAPVRSPAVLDGRTRRHRRRSVPRLLLGAAGVAAAALVVVALFRPDGPLDPPLSTPDAANRATSAAVAPAAVPPTPPPVPAIEGVRGADEPAAVRIPEAVRAGGPRSTVDTTPPPAPNLRSAPPAPSRPDTAGSLREGAPVRTPPTPAAPRA